MVDDAIDGPRQTERGGPRTGPPPVHSLEIRDRRRALLELDGRALLFELLLELLGLGLVEVFLDGLGGAFDQVLGFLEAQAGGGADDLDDLDLLVAGGLEDDVEGGLLLFLLGRGRGAAAATAPSSPPPAAGSICGLSLR